MCRSFEIVEPCSHLWCGHKDSPLVCKTKKGPPLEGTECDFGKVNAIKISLVKDHDLLCKNNSPISVMYTYF